MVSKASKILFGIGALLALGGIICFVVGSVTGAKGIEVKFVAADKSSFTLPVSGAQCGFSLYMKRGGDCDDVHSKITVSGPEGKSLANGMTLVKDCKINDNAEWGKEEDLVKVGQFAIPEKNGTSNTLTGMYTVTSPVALWAVDMCGQVFKSARGILAFLALLVVAIALLVIGSILCCVGCCVLSSDKPNFSSRAAELQA